MSALDDFLRKNQAGEAARVKSMLGSEAKNLTSGKLGKLFVGLGIADILKAHGAFGKIKETVKQVWYFTVGWKAVLAGLYPMLRGTIGSMVRETGSLEAALNRIRKLQGMERVFAPFLGGLNNARRKVAELFLLGRRTPFSFDQWARAGQSLVTMTRGMFSDSKSLMLVGDTALSTGNDVADVADVIADFYANIREGKPVGDLVEKMRQMGAISSTSADSLRDLAETGADVTDITRELTSALSHNEGAIGSLKGNLASVEDQYLKTKIALQEKFGQPFTEAEIDNVRNYTAAMQALEPSIGRLGGFFQKFFGVFSTVKSAFAKWIADSAAARVVVESLVKALTLLVSVVSLGAVMWLGRLAIAFGVASQAAGAFGLALRAALIGSGVGAILVAVGLLTQGLINLADSTKEAADAASAEAKAHRDAQNAMRDRINAIRTLTDQQEALKDATDALIESQEKQRQLDAEAGQEKPKGMLGSAWNWLKEKAGIYDSGSADARARINRGQVALQQRNVKDILAKSGSLMPGVAEQRQMEIDRQRNLALEESQLRLRASRGEDPLKIDLERLAITRKRSSEADSGIAAAAEVERKRQQAELAFQQLRAQPGVTAGRLNQAEAAKLDLGLRAPQSSSVFAETMAQKIEHAIAAGDGRLSQQARERERALAGGVAADPTMLAYWKKFAETQKELENNAPDLASSVAQQKADVFDKLTPVASSMARIGGGGNVASPLETIGEQQRDLLQQILEELRGDSGTSGMSVPNEPNPNNPLDRR